MWSLSHQVRLLLTVSDLFVSTEDSAIKSAGVCRPDRNLLSTVEAAAKVGVCKASCCLIQQNCGGVACAAAIHQVEHALQIASKPRGIGFRVTPYEPIICTCRAISLSGNKLSECSDVEGSTCACCLQGPSRNIPLYNTSCFQPACCIDDCCKPIQERHLYKCR